MVHNVLAIDALTSDGQARRFGPLRDDGELSRWLRGLYAREREEIAARFPQVLRRVAGYNLDHLGPPHENAAHLLVGSEGTLAWFERLHLKLSPLPPARALGVCHFPTFRKAMELTQHIVKLGPTAVELVDRTMIGLARANAAFRDTVNAAIRGDPDAILLVEFSGEDALEQARRLGELSQLLGDLGLPGSVVEVTDARQQRGIWEVRKAGLNIMMSMKGDGKPVSFIEDCAVPLEHLAEYTERLTRVFEKHGTRGTWYAHASVGTLHVRPILDMRADGGAKMRAIAEEACAMVKEYKGAYSGEHGDGLVRSEWIAPFFGPRLTATLGEIKAKLDPRGLMNPGKIVDPPKMDDARLFRFPPGYATQTPPAALDWSEWGGFDKAVEMCNNNGHCRKFDAGTMCPSFRATGDEMHLTRGRANTLRLALSGQLGETADDDVKRALDLCVSCKGCRRECPTGVDMARMKIEFLAHYRQRHRLTLRERLIAYLPHYAPWAARLAPLANLGNALPRIRQALTGFSARRALPRWRRNWFIDRAWPKRGSREVVLLVDTFNRYFEPENVRAAVRVLVAADYRVHIAQPDFEDRPLCCGRTFLTLGMVAQARREAQRTYEAMRRWVDHGVPIIGLEPSCLYTLRDEYPALLPETRPLAEQVMLFEEFLDAERRAGRFAPAFKAIPGDALLHGHCHQKAFAGMGAVQSVLGLVPGLRVSMIESGCCGMAGAFGYEAEHYEASMKMGELGLLPAVRKADADTLLIADGTSCRHQIRDGAGRRAVHVARVLEQALEG
jgi:Fe-S oxidoreductase/FAD/FMN-containing dehydrogenase